MCRKAVNHDSPRKTAPRLASFPRDLHAEFCPANAFGIEPGILLYMSKVCSLRQRACDN